VRRSDRKRQGLSTRGGGGRGVRTVQGADVKEMFRCGSTKQPSTLRLHALVLYMKHCAESISVYSVKY